jgi:hypothetical protein
LPFFLPFSGVPEEGGHAAAQRIGFDRLAEKSKFQRNLHQPKVRVRVNRPRNGSRNSPQILTQPLRVEPTGPVSLDPSPGLPSTYRKRKKMADPTVAFLAPNRFTSDLKVSANLTGEDEYAISFRNLFQLITIIG